MTKQNYLVKGMTCAACANSVESILTAQKGVDSAVVNFAANSVLIVFDEETIKVPQLEKVVSGIGYELVIHTIDPDVQRKEQKENFNKLRTKFFVALSFSLPVFVISMFMLPIPYSPWVQLLLSIPVLFYSGVHFYTSAFKKARHFTFTMDTLIALGTGAAFLFSLFNTIFPELLQQNGFEAHVYYESAVVIVTLILLGNLLEERAKQKTSGAIEKLVSLQPDEATILFINKPTKVKIKDVKKGDVVLIKPGETIPVDGEIIFGNSFINESMLTGESVPTEKMVGHKVSAGTVNSSNVLHIKATHTGSTTTLSKIIRYVQEAQGSKAPIQKLVDKISSIFVPLVISIALGSGSIWYFLGPSPQSTYAILVLVTVLIIACPCALGLATPTAIMVGIGRAAQQGVLIRDAESLENLKDIEVLFVDKTGTLTEGQPTVDHFLYHDKNKALLSVLYTIESNSEHPLSNSIIEFLVKEKVTPDSVIDTIENFPGQGIEAKVKEEIYRVGKPDFVMSENQLNPFTKEVEKLKSTSHTIVAFGNRKEVLALIGIKDVLKQDAPKSVKQIQKLGIEVVMLTGDNEQNAMQIAEICSIKTHKANILPHEKAEMIKYYQGQGKKVAMAGDGINDAPALAQADVGIAMGNGTDIAMESASITLVKSDLKKIETAIQLSKLTTKTIRQNLFWAFFYNTLSIPVAAGVLYPTFGFLLNPMIAGGAMAFSSLSVVMNSLWLKKRLM